MCFMLYKLALTLNPWIKSQFMTIQMKAEDYFLVIFFVSIMLHKVILTFASVAEILNCDH